MNKFGPKASAEVQKAMHEFKHGDKYKNRKQAIAVGLSKARQAGGKAPKQS